MIERTMQNTARDLWTKYPVVTITGPRQSGKTTLARTVFPNCEYVNLEAPDVREEVISDMRGFLERHRNPIIFDEIQNVPELVSYVQADVDERGGCSRYVLTGSHQPALQAAVSQSLAGRTGLLELLPLTLSELSRNGVRKKRDDWIYNGFMPRLYASGIEATRLYSDYFRTYVERDIRQLANLRSLRPFETFIRLLAGRVGQILNMDSLSGDVGVSSSTIREWLSLLEASYIIYTLHPYYRNFGKRFTKSPKVYFTETGLATYLLGIKSVGQVETHPLCGSLFENMVVMDMLKSRLNKGLNADLYYMRTSRGVEVDVVEENGNRLDLYEIKSSATFHDGMADNLRTIARMLPDEIERQTVIYAGRPAMASEGIAVVNFANRNDDAKTEGRGKRPSV